MSPELARRRRTAAEPAAIRGPPAVSAIGLMAARDPKRILAFDPIDLIRMAQPTQIGG